MTNSRKKNYRKQTFSRIMRGRFSVNTSQYYSAALKAYWPKVEQDYLNAMVCAEKAKTFGAIHWL